MTQYLPTGSSVEPEVEVFTVVDISPVFEVLGEGDGRCNA